jgi:ribosomal protein S18 acetylase RimI-like enzyme
VHVASLGFRTDLAVRRLGGSEALARDGYIVVRTPANPDYWWGNFVLLHGPVSAGDGPRLRATFAAEFPDAAHLAFGIDGTRGEVDDPRVQEELGLSVEVNAVLTAAAPKQPVRAADADAAVRRLTSDEDWEQAAALRLAVYELEDVPGQPEFVGRQFAESRAICERGDGAWFGAFAGGQRLVAALGLLRASPGAARYQSVETHPSFQRRGLASRLLYESSVWARDALNAEMVVIVADPEYHAIEVYKALGFVEVERQAQLERAPDEPSRRG